MRPHEFGSLCSFTVYFQVGEAVELLPESVTSAWMQVLINRICLELVFRERISQR
jgi:hypothetical protein